MLEYKLDGGTEYCQRNIPTPSIRLGFRDSADSDIVPEEIPPKREGHISGICDQQWDHATMA